MVPLANSWGHLFIGEIMNKVPYVYKLRAECLRDICVFLPRVFFTDCRIIPHWPAGAELEFKTTLDIEEIKVTLLEIPDSHVMRETLNFKTKYTGERK
jgi:hypothetical protein